MHDPAAERLNQLQRQRKLVQEHLAWLDAQIRDAASALGSTGEDKAASNPPPAQRPDESAVATGAAPAAGATPPNADVAVPSVPENEGEALLERYRRHPTELHRDVRAGCLLYFVAALLLTAAVVTALYFALRLH